MKVTCGHCGETYDDAERWTTCPHLRMLSPELQAQKDAALALLGHEVCFAHQPDGPAHRIGSISWDGMVTLDGMSGEFAPHLFMVAKGGRP